MSLIEFIEQNRRTIIREWVAFAASLTPWSTQMSNRELEDHAKELLAAVVADMRTSQTGNEQEAKGKGHQVTGGLGRVGKAHAVERLESGLKLDQLVSEYRALRASVLRLWDQKHANEQAEMTRFNEAIDETLAESANWYSLKMTETRDQFLAILGHDLRNPIASILMGASALARPGNNEIKQLGIATRIRNSAERMNRMVNDLLDLTRTRLGAGIPVIRTPIDLATLIQLVVEELAAIHPETTLRFDAEGDLRGEWDSDRLHQVISNLIANALQYGTEDAQVTITAAARGQAVIVRVHNEGAAIAPKKLKTMFEPLVRLPSENSNDQNPTGLGLGLFIAREIVAAHAGTLTVASTEAGTTFTAELPRRALDNKKRTAIAERKTAASKKSENKKKKKKKKNAATTKRRTTTSTARARRGKGAGRGRGPQS